MVGRIPRWVWILVVVVVVIAVCALIGARGSCSIAGHGFTIG